MQATPMQSTEDSATQEHQAEDYLSVLMERNFLRRATADLNFHNNAHDGIVYLDDQGQVVYTNPYFLEMMGFESPQEILNKPLPAYVWENPDEQGKIVNDVRTNGYVREREVRLKNQEGTPVFAMCSSVASKDDNGNFVGVEIMLCNITSKRKIQVELETRTKELERVTEFANVTIELLTDAVQHGASAAELLVTLRDLQTRLNKVTQSR